MKNLMLALVLALMLPLGCGTPNTRPVGRLSGNVSPAMAAQIAIEQFDKQYPGRIVHYKLSVHWSEENNTWTVTFDGQGRYAAPGGYTTIEADARTGRATLLPSF